MRNDKTTYGAPTVRLHSDIRENLYTGQKKNLKKIKITKKECDHKQHQHRKSLGAKHRPPIIKRWLDGSDPMCVGQNRLPCSVKYP